MKFSQIFTAPNQLTLLRMIFVPFIVIHLVDGHYRWALVVFVIAGFSDGLDGLLARKLHQQTLLGQYLDPIADKLLLSTMFLVLSILHKIPWKYHRVGFQPRYFHSRGQRRPFRDSRTAELSPQHLRQGQHFLADHRRFFCALVARFVPCGGYGSRER